ncbi:hypothetical protein ACFXC8_00185 [Streptomyces sp. NPDC059441]|uniref:hypothetical protein n=1 Tax=Streptomyces sp. NPDC059441 TaxID=3346829 RepID=UPI0036AB5DAB
MSARRQIIAALSEDSLGGIATLEDVAHAEQLVDAHRTEVLAEVTTWLIKKAREFHVSSRKKEREQGDTCAVLASKIARGAVRPDNLLMLPSAGFFEVDRTYQREHHGAVITFKVSAISLSPDGRLTVAHGWRTSPDFGWEPTDSDDMTGWVEVTEDGAT